MSTPTPASRIQANLQDLFQANLTSGKAYIRFKLSADISALLSMKQVRRSIVVEAEKITPMPGMLESVIGIMSSSDRVFCIFDLARLLTISSQVAVRRQYQILVLQTDTEPPINLGLAVTELQGTLRCPAEQIQPLPSNIGANLTPYFQGAVVEKEETIPILEFDYILQTLTTAQR